MSKNLQIQYTLYAKGNDTDLSEHDYHIIEYNLKNDSHFKNFKIDKPEKSRNSTFNSLKLTGSITEHEVSSLSLIIDTIKSELSKLMNTKNFDNNLYLTADEVFPIDLSTLPPIVNTTLTIEKKDKTFIKSISGIDKMVTLPLSSLTIANPTNDCKGLISVLKCKNVKSLYLSIGNYESYLKSKKSLPEEAKKIIMNHWEDKNILKCTKELIEAGYKDIL